MCRHAWEERLCASLTACHGIRCRRDHAQIIAEDKDLTDIFTKWCYMEWRDNNWRDCYSDEHYLGTLLASKVCRFWQIIFRQHFWNALCWACPSLCKQSMSPDDGSHLVP